MAADPDGAEVQADPPPTPPDPVADAVRRWRAGELTGAEWVRAHWQATHPGEALPDAALAGQLAAAPEGGATVNSTQLTLLSVEELRAEIRRLWQVNHHLQETIDGLRAQAATPSIPPNYTWVTFANGKRELVQTGPDEYPREGWDTTGYETIHREHEAQVRRVQDAIHRAR